MQPCNVFVECRGENERFSDDLTSGMRLIVRGRKLHDPDDFHDGEPSFACLMILKIKEPCQ